MKDLSHNQIKTMCDSTHFDIDFNLVLSELEKKFGASPDNIYPFYKVCQTIKSLL